LPHTRLYTGTYSHLRARATLSRKFQIAFTLANRKGVHSIGRSSQGRNITRPSSGRDGKARRSEERSSVSKAIWLKGARRLYMSKRRIRGSVRDRSELEVGRRGPAPKHLCNYHGHIVCDW
jgi:hypothetical protein